MAKAWAISPDLLQPAFIQDWQQANFRVTDDSGLVEQYVDGKGLACPMPLLKLKMALKHTKVGNHVYVTATDPNSQQDIGAFCRHAGHGLITHQTDTIFHLFITKNC